MGCAFSWSAWLKQPIYQPPLVKSALNIQEDLHIWECSSSLYEGHRVCITMSSYPLLVPPTLSHLQILKSPTVQMLCNELLYCTVSILALKRSLHVQQRRILLPNVFEPWLTESKDVEHTTQVKGQLYWAISNPLVCFHGLYGFLTPDCFVILC